MSKNYICYCDGAVKNNGKKNPDAPTYGGVGVIIINERDKILYARGFGFAEKGRFGRKITNNIMELKAVICSIIAFRKNIKDSNAILTICSDSEYVVKGFNERIRKWIHDDWCVGDGSPVKNREMWEKILDLTMDKKSPNVRFIHVDGHNGDKYNEMADKLAVEAKDRAIKRYEGKEAS